MIYKLTTILTHEDLFMIQIFPFFLNLYILNILPRAVSTQRMIYKHKFKNKKIEEYYTPQMLFRQLMPFTSLEVHWPQFSQFSQN